MLNNEPCKLLLDTGSTHCLIKKELAERLKLEQVGTFRGFSLSAGEGGVVVKASLLQISHWLYQDVPLAVFYSESEHLPCDGILGYLILKDFEITINYRKETLFFAEQNTFVPV